MHTLMYSHSKACVHTQQFLTRELRDQGACCPLGRHSDVRHYAREKTGELLSPPEELSEDTWMGQLEA